MTRPGCRRLFATLAASVFAVGFSLAMAVPAGAAGQGYGPPPTAPPPPPPTTCPTGNVVSSTAIGPGGGTVSGTVDGSTVTVSVPPGAFPDGATVAILDTSSTAVAPTGDTLVLAFGIAFCVDGTKFTGTFSPPATVTVTNPAIRPGQTFYQQTGTTLTPVPGVTISNGSLSFSVSTDPDYVLVASITTNATVIPGATSVVTGKPFLLEGLVGGALVLAGGLLLALFVRVRLRHR